MSEATSDDVGRLAEAVEHLVDVGITIVDVVRELVEAVQASTDITECGYEDDSEY